MDDDRVPPLASPAWAALLLFALVWVAPAGAQVTMLDPTPGAAYGSSIALGSDGLGLIAYYVQGPNDLRVAHCSNPACTAATITTLDSVGDVGSGASLAIGSDGLGLIAYHDYDHTQLKMAHCLDLACTSADIVSLGYATSGIGQLIIGSDGLGLIFGFAISSPGGTASRVAHCQDVACSSVDFASHVFQFPGGAAVGTDGFPLLIETSSLPQPNSIRAHHCQDVPCTSSTPSGLLVTGGASSLNVGADGLGLFLYRVFDLPVAQHGIAHCADTACTAVTTAPTLEGSSMAIGPDGLAVLGYEAVLTLRLAHCDDPACSTLTVSAPIDSSAWLTEMTVGADGLPLVAYSANGRGLKVAHCSMTSCPYDGPTLTVHDAAVVEGDAGPTTGSILLTLSKPSVDTVLVGTWTYGGGGGTATPMEDFEQDQGLAVFEPGETTKTIPFTVIGDTSVEPDETFNVNIQFAEGAVTVDDRALVTIIDDDAPAVPSEELVHGSALVRNLAAAAGPSADVDYYRIGQPPRSSWEVVVDGASGGVAPLALDRLAADGTTVLQAAQPVSGGSALSMRFANALGAPVANQHLRIQAMGCGAACGPEATYRVRAYETTGAIARLNNSGTQATVVVLRNGGDSALSGSLWFWAGTGALLTSEPFAIGPRGSTAINTAVLPGMATASGSITVTHDAPFGVLSGKAVAVEPATGFTFDTPLTFRP